MKLPIQGVCPIVAAPFTDTGAVDYDSFRSLVRHLLTTGINALTLFGLATEFYKLSDDDRKAMRSIMLRETSASSVNGIVSITDHSYEVAVVRAKEAEAEGADALMLLPPFFLGPGLNDIASHIEAVLKAVTIPVMVQYAPNQTGVKIDASFFAGLFRSFGHAHFVKVETQPPGPYIEALRSLHPGINCFVGYAGVQMPDALDRGASGVQPGCSFAELYVQMDKLYRSGRSEEMRVLHSRLLPYISYWMQSVELIIKAEKTILQKRGIIRSDYCRAPAYKLDPREIEGIDRFIQLFLT